MAYRDPALAPVAERFAVGVAAKRERAALCRRPQRPGGG
jgi:hypothetical protein